MGSDIDEEPRYEYVTHLERNCDGQQLAAAISSREVKLYARETMHLAGQLAGHTGPLTQLAFAPSDANALYSCSEDGDCKGWDTRTMKSTVKFGQSGEEMWSMAVSWLVSRCIKLQLQLAFYAPYNSSISTRFHKSVRCCLP